MLVGVTARALFGHPAGAKGGVLLPGSGNQKTRDQPGVRGEQGKTTPGTSSTGTRSTPAIKAASPSPAAR